MLNEIQIAVLISQALRVRENAYAPYSGFKVGAIAIDERERIFPGCNVENSSHGLSLCAERASITLAVAHGAKRLKGLLLVSQSYPPATPCGACLQWMAEFAEPEMEIIVSNPTGDYLRYQLKQLLPNPFHLL